MVPANRLKPDRMAATPTKNSRKTQLEPRAPEERRQLILDAAANLFRSRPYGDVSLAQVADAAGVARGLINHYFDTKRGLYVEVMRRMLRIETPPVPAYVHGAALEQRVDESVKLWLAEIEENSELWLDSVRAQGMGDPEIAEIIERARENAARSMAAVVGLGPPDDLPPEQLARLRVWVAMGEAAILQWLEHGRLTREQVHDLVRNTVVEGVTGMLDGAADGTA